MTGKLVQHVARAVDEAVEPAHEIARALHDPFARSGILEIADEHVDAIGRVARASQPYIEQVKVDLGCGKAEE